MGSLFIIFIMSSLISCSNTDKVNSNDIIELLKDSQSLAGTMKDQFVLSKDSVLLPEFEIELKLSEKAEKKLKAQNESIIVRAHFSGIPKDTAMSEYLKYGSVNIGSYGVELFDKRIAKFENVKISNDAFELLSDKNFEVLINIVSGRRSSQFNILSVDILQGKIDSIRTKRHILNGKLIQGE